MPAAQPSPSQRSLENSLGGLLSVALVEAVYADSLESPVVDTGGIPTQHRAAWPEVRTGHMHLLPIPMSRAPLCQGFTWRPRLSPLPLSPDFIGPVAAKRGHQTARANERTSWALGSGGGSELVQVSVRGRWPWRGKTRGRLLVLYFCGVSTKGIRTVFPRPGHIRVQEL